MEYIVANVMPRPRRHASQTTRLIRNRDIAGISLRGIFRSDQAMKGLEGG
jgi:hypothetical protein